MEALYLQAPSDSGMTLTFENDSDVIVYALQKILSFARENQYLFVANCVWRIAGIIGLDSGLVIHINNLESRRGVALRVVSTTPRDIARSVSVKSDQINLEEELLPRKGKTRQRPWKTLTRNQRRKLAKQNNKALKPQ